VRHQISLRNSLAKTNTHISVPSELSRSTFVGIDFGTSTTVASYVVAGEGDLPIKVSRFQIRQPLHDGRAYSHFLVPTSLAWWNDQFLFGQGARDIAANLISGRSYWSSFKMQLGLDLGPRYYDSILGEGHPVATVLTPLDAASEYLKLLRRAIETEVNRLGLPSKIRYSVSIPASFEANQRRDLTTALGRAGIQLDDTALVDEPNAAFLSYLGDAHLNELGEFNLPEGGSVDVLVFDFGAGTCDISVLRITFDGGRLATRNLSISRFEALGGDNIDHAIATRVLLPQLERQNGVNHDDWRMPDLKKRILPTLRTIAEELKILACKSLGRNHHGTALPALAGSTDAVRIPRDFRLRLPKMTLQLSEPELQLSSFAGVMRDFVDPDSRFDSPGDEGMDSVCSVFTPINSALKKAGLESDDLDVVLMVGGSCENPLVQNAISSHFPRDTVIVPMNLRAHVATGAALNSFLIHGLRQLIVRPITSEPILALTRDNADRILVPDGTEMPSATFRIEDLTVGRDDQRTIEIPLCVGGRHKILTVIRLSPTGAEAFAFGARVKLTGKMTIDKLLKVEAQVDGQSVVPDLVSPFANRSLTTRERQLLEAQRRAHISAARHGGRPSIEALVGLAEAFDAAGLHRHAAETFETLQRLDPDQGYETNICYHWSHAGREDLSAHWAELAHEANPGAVTAYNLSLSDSGAPNRPLLREALRFDPDYAPALWVLGCELEREGDPEGKEMILRALRVLEEQLEDKRISESDCSLLIRVATQIGAQQTAETARTILLELNEAAGEYDHENLLTTNGDAKLNQRLRS
jgi:molecular chaperone DnaK